MSDTIPRIEIRELLEQRIKEQRSMNYDKDTEWMGLAIKDLHKQLEELEKSWATIDKQYREYSKLRDKMFKIAISIANEVGIGQYIVENSPTETLVDEIARRGNYIVSPARYDYDKEQIAKDYILPLIQKDYVPFYPDAHDVANKINEILKNNGYNIQCIEEPQD